MSELVPSGSRKVAKVKRGQDSKLALQLAADRGRTIRAAQQIHDIERVGDYGLRAAGHLGRVAEYEAASCQTSAMQQAILSTGVRAVGEIREAIQDLKDDWS
jgi:hypothetical protein